MFVNEKKMEEMSQKMEKYQKKIQTVESQCKVLQEERLAISTIMEKKIKTLVMNVDIAARSGSPGRLHQHIKALADLVDASVEALRS